MMGAFRKDRTNYEKMGSAMEQIAKPKPENLERIKTALGGIREEINLMEIGKLEALGAMLMMAPALTGLIGAAAALQTISGSPSNEGTGTAPNNTIPPAVGSGTPAGTGAAPSAAGGGGTVYHVTVPIDVGGERIQELIISLANDQIETKLNDLGTSAMLGSPAYPTSPR
jgi:hypothetical protein